MNPIAYLTDFSCLSIASWKGEKGLAFHSYRRSILFNATTNGIFLATKRENEEEKRREEIELAQKYERKVCERERDE